MNHDLFLRRPPIATPLTFEELQDLIRDDPGLSPLVNDEHTTPERLVLANPDTGAYVMVAPGGPPEGLFTEEPVEEAEDELGGLPDLAAPLDHLHVQIPYLWPRPLAAEGAEMTVALARVLKWALEDSADPAATPPADRDVDAVLRSWEAARKSLVAELAADPEAGELRRLPAALLAGIHGSNRRRRETLAAAGPGVEVPRLVLVELGGEEPGALCRYTAGEPVWLPDAATHVLLARKKKGFLGYRDEEVVVRADELRALLGRAEKAGEAPAGRRSYRPTWPATDKIWGTIAGRPPKEASVIDPSGVIEAEA